MPCSSLSPSLLCYQVIHQLLLNRYRLPLLWLFVAADDDGKNAVIVFLACEDDMVDMAVVLQDPDALATGTQGPAAPAASASGIPIPSESPPSARSRDGQAVDKNLLLQQLRAVPVEDYNPEMCAR